jgi:gluconolactonase
VWFGDGRFLLWSDIPNDRIMKWEGETGAVSVFRKPSHYANGNTRDRQGRLVTCEMDAQRLTRTEYDGTVTVLAERFEGKRLTAPNDVVVKSDGSIWFSDNGAGTRGNYLGHKAPWELPLRVYRLDPATGEMTIAVGDMKRPNGLAFSPDEKLLYVVDTPGALGPRTLQVYDVVDNGSRTANGRLFFNAEPGGTDGIRVDVHGNVWCAFSGGEAEDGVAVFAPDGTMIGRILLPERCANVCFGGIKRNRLFMAASQSVYSLYVETQGVLGG